MRACIWRDDDLSMYSDLDRFEPLLDISQRFGVICSAYVPNISHSADVGYEVGHKALDVIKLKRWIASGYVELLMHGIHHTYFNGRAEFEQNNIISKKQLIFEKKNMEKIFNCEINTFVPPHNAINKKHFVIVREVFRHISTSFCHLPNERPFEIAYMSKFAKCAFVVAKHGPEVKNYFRLWQPVMSKKCKEHESVGYVPNYGIENLQKAFEHFCRVGAIETLPFCFNTHYWELTGKMLDDLNYFLLHNKVKLIGFNNV